MKPLTIGQLAKQAQVHIETVRYYERKGLIPKPQRLQSGYRQYSRDYVVRIQLIKRAQSLGFSLKEIKELLFLQVAPDTTCKDVKRHAEAKIAAIEEKINALSKMKESLLLLIDKCSEDDAPIADCPVIEALTQEQENGYF